MCLALQVKPLPERTRQRCRAGKPAGVAAGEAPAAGGIAGEVCAKDIFGQSGFEIK
jgi:hypothetical protein